MPARDVTSQTFAEDVINQSWNRPVVVDFWADWCGPCKVLGPILDKAEVDGQGSWELTKVDVDANQDLAMQFGVQGIPTVIGFVNGEAVARFTGALPDAQVRSWLDELMPSDADVKAAAGREALEGDEPDRAESLFSDALALDPSHQAAGIGLAEIRIDQERPADAEELLKKLMPTEEVQKLLAAARLSGAADLDEAERALAADPENNSSRLEYGKALLAEARLEEGFEVLLDLVSARVPESEPARQAIVDVFETLGNDHPLVAPTRTRLASALY